MFQLQVLCIMRSMECSIFFLLLWVVNLSRAINIYPYMNDPGTHPDYDRYIVKHPTYSTFGGKPRFATLRSFQIESLHVVNYEQDIDQYLLRDNTSLGSVIWPAYPLLYTRQCQRSDRLHSQPRICLLPGFGDLYQDQDPVTGANIKKVFHRSFIHQQKCWHIWNKRWVNGGLA